MAYTLVQQNDSLTTSTTTGTVTLTVASGSLLVLLVVHRGGNSITISDSQTQTWTLSGSTQYNGAERTGLYYCANTYTGSLTVTSTAGASDTAIILHLSEWTGQHATPHVSSDGISNAVGSTSHPHGSTGINATAGQLIVTVLGQTSLITDETVASGFTAFATTVGGNNRLYGQYRIATGTENGVTAAVSSSATASTGRIALFNVAASSGGVPVFIHHLKQQGIA